MVTEKKMNIPSVPRPLTSEGIARATAIMDMNKKSWAIPELLSKHVSLIWMNFRPLIEAWNERRKIAMVTRMPILD